MADSHRLARRAERQQASYAIGRDSRLPRMLQGQLRHDLDQADILHSSDVGRDLQMQDPVTGNLYFCAGVDVFGAP